MFEFIPKKQFTIVLQKITSILQVLYAFTKSKFSVINLIYYDLMISFEIEFDFGTYIVFHRFGQAKFAEGGSILGSSQLSLLSKLPLKMTLELKWVKINMKITTSFL